MGHEVSGREICSGGSLDRFLRIRWFFIILAVSDPGNQSNQSVWVLPKIGVPKNGWFRIENPIKSMIWGYHHFRKSSYHSLNYSQFSSKFDDFNLFETCFPHHLSSHWDGSKLILQFLVEHALSKQCFCSQFPTRNLRNGFLEIVQSLCEARANVEQVDEDGTSTVEIAHRSGHSVIETLLTCVKKMT